MIALGLPGLIGAGAMATPSALPGSRQTAPEAVAAARKKPESRRVSGVRNSHCEGRCGFIECFRGSASWHMRCTGWGHSHAPFARSPPRDAARHPPCGGLPVDTGCRCERVRLLRSDDGGSRRSRAPVLCRHRRSAHGCLDELADDSGSDPVAEGGRCQSLRTVPSVSAPGPSPRRAASGLSLHLRAADLSHIQLSDHSVNADSIWRR
jgi:hypothetical protein